MDAQLNTGYLTNILIVVAETLGMSKNIDSSVKNIYNQNAIVSLQAAPASTAAATSRPNSDSTASFPAFGATNATANFDFSHSQQPASFPFK